MTTNEVIQRAMQYAREQHSDQVRKYTGNPYWTHLAEVAGIVAGATIDEPDVLHAEMIATAWLHDVVEDTSASHVDIMTFFGTTVAHGVIMLTDAGHECGNRARRKEIDRNRLAKAGGWIQSIKCADIISNTSSIVRHDPEFAVVYLQEKTALLAVLGKADRKLLQVAKEQVVEGLVHLGLPAGN